MAWSKAYARITWVNEPSTDTPLNATNLNRMDVALNEIDNRVLQLQGSAYVHIKYSAHAAPTNIQMSNIPDVYMGICVTSEETAPTQADAYTWNRVRGEKVMLQADNEYIQWKYESDANWTNIIALSELKGDTGEKGDTGTAATITISDTTTSAAGGNASVENIGTPGAAILKFTIPRGSDGSNGSDGDDGREIELQKSASHIQWRYVGGAWSDLVALSDLKGDTGDTGAGLEYHWSGTQLGVRVAGEQTYTYVDLIGETGETGDTGDTGQRGSRWSTGTAITGTSTTPSVYATGITDSFVDDWYINPTTSNVYRCTASGDAATAKWVYSHNQKGADGLGAGDMLKSVYDTNDNGTVDDADKLGGNLPTYYAKATDIPDISGKADKVTGASTGNFAGLDSNGNLTDSGSKPADFAQANAIPDISGKADKVANATTGNFAALNAIGNLTDSGNKAADFALTSAIPDISGKLDKSGGTMTGALILAGDPTQALYAATKQYVDNKVKTDVPLNAKFTDTIVDISGKLNKSNDTLETYTEKIQATTGTINLSLANVFSDTPTASRTYSITNAKSGVAHSFTLIITMGSTVRTLTFPASVKWQGGEIPDMSTANKTYVLTFVTINGGTTWLGVFGGEF